MVYHNNAISSQGFSVFRLVIPKLKWRHFPYIANLFQILSTLADYEKLAVGFEPVRSGEIFWIIVNKAEWLSSPTDFFVKYFC